MPDTSIELAKRFSVFAGDRKCLSCNKTEWGAEFHEAKCPFGVAYASLKKDATNVIKQALSRVEFIDGEGG